MVFWHASTWGELAGIVVYVLGMRIYAELLLEQRAQLHSLPRYMVRITKDDWGQLIFWPVMAMVCAIADVFGAKERNANIRKFVEHQRARAPRERHPHMLD